MLDGLLSSIRQIGVFMICAQALIHFKPKGSYEKYLKLLVSAMVLVQLLSPIAALLIGGEGQGLEERIAAYSASFEQGLGEAALEEYRIEQLRRQLLAAQLEQLDIGVSENGDMAQQAEVTAEDGRQDQAEVTAENGRQDQAEVTAENGRQDQAEVTAEDGRQDQAEVTAENGRQEQPEKTAEDGEQDQPEEIRIRIDPVNITVP